MIRLLKAWKYNKNVPISAFYLEMMGANMPRGSEFIILLDLCLTLEKLAESGMATMNDPTKMGPRFNTCSTETYRIDALSKMRTAAEHARNAFSAQYASQHAVAIRELKLLFGL